MAGDASTALLEAMAAGTVNGSSMPGLLAQLGESDPRLAAVGQILARRRAEQEAAAAEEADRAADASTVPAPDSTDAKRAAIRHLRGIVSDMYQELEALRFRNDQLAAALGACNLCWGEDTGCAACGGRGRPGHHPPDRRLFARFVAPAARRLQPRATAPAAPINARTNG